MALTPAFIHSLVISSITALTSIGAGIGQGITSFNAVTALNRQPAAHSDINRSTLLGLALIETAALLGLLISLILLFSPVITLYGAIAQIGIASALALPGFTIGIVSSFPAGAGLLSIARQPFLGKKIMNAILLTLSLIQTPLVFGLIIAWIIQTQLSTITTLGQALTLLASGFCIGFGSIGPLLGGGVFTKSACTALGINKTAYSKIVPFTLISQAIIETPIIFAAIIAFWLITLAAKPLSTATGLIYLAVAFVMAIGTWAPGISSGRTAKSACTSIAINPSLYGTLVRTSVFAQALIDTCVIYAFIIAILLILLPI